MGLGAGVVGAGRFGGWGWGFGSGGWVGGFGWCRARSPDETRLDITNQMAASGINPEPSKHNRNVNQSNNNILINRRAGKTQTIEHIACLPVRTSIIYVLEPRVLNM